MLLNTIIAVIKLTKAQFFNPSSTNLLTMVHWAKIQYYLGLSQEIVTLQLLYKKTPSIIKKKKCIKFYNKIINNSLTKKGCVIYSLKFNFKTIWNYGFFLYIIISTLLLLINIFTNIIIYFNLRTLFLKVLLYFFSWIKNFASFFYLFIFLLSFVL